MKQPIQKILYCLIWSILAVVALYAINANKVAPKNGFNRNYRQVITTPVHLLDLKYSSYYIAGHTQDHLYLGNGQAPIHAIRSDLTFTDTVHLELKIPVNSNGAGNYARLVVDSPEVYLMEGVTPLLLHGYTDSYIMAPFQDKSAFFLSAIAVSPLSIVKKSTDAKLQRLILLKQSGQKNELAKQRYIPSKIGDGLFSSDGILLFNEKAAKLIFINYYSNHFTSLDTNLHVIYSQHTIDTIRMPKIKVAMLASDHKQMLASPPVVVNEAACVTDNQVFVHSNLAADNEDSRRFFNGSAIDVYNLANGEYQYSLYISTYQKKKIIEFQVVDNLLVIVYDHFICSYLLN